MSCPARAQWQQEMFVDLQKKSNNLKTKPELLDILIEGLKSWFEQRKPEFNMHTAAHVNLIRKQSRAGWDQLLFGRFVQEWRDIQDDHLRKNKEYKQHQNGRAWVVKTIEIIWGHVYTTWEIRNAALHGVVESAQELARIETAKRETEAVYEIREDVLPRDHDVFYATLEEHYEQEPTSRGLRQWLLTWKPTLLQSAKQAVTFGTQGMVNIQNYFQFT